MTSYQLDILIQRYTETLNNLNENENMFQFWHPDDENIFERNVNGWILIRETENIVMAQRLLNLNRTRSHFVSRYTICIVCLN